LQAPRVLLDCHRDNLTSSSEDSENSIDPNVTPCLKSSQHLQLFNRPAKRQKRDTEEFGILTFIHSQVIKLCVTVSVNNSFGAVFIKVIVFFNILTDTG